MSAYVTRVTVDLDRMIDEPDERWCIEIRRNQPGWQPSALDIPPDIRNALIEWATGNAEARRMLEETISEKRGTTDEA